MVLPSIVRVLYLLSKISLTFLNKKEEVSPTGNEGGIAVISLRVFPKEMVMWYFLNSAFLNL